jgi:flavorubredoxin
MITELAKDIYSVGVIDWNRNHFHGHELTLGHGTTYNAYLIIDKEVVLVDSVMRPFDGQLIDNIRRIIDPAKITKIVANHAEMDHSGGISTVLHHAPEAEVIVSRRGNESIPGHFHQEWNFKTVKTGDKISIGKRELTFIEAPMVHWPDSMFTYVGDDGILMPNDAFGQHLAADRRFNDQVDTDLLYSEAFKYYVNILTPFSDIIKKKIDELIALDLPISMIAPSHGIIWRKDPLQIVHKYVEWTRQEPEKRAVILYDTMYDATLQMAEAIGEGLLAEEVPFAMTHLSLDERSDVLMEVFRSRALIFGSPTVNNGPMPTLRPYLADLKHMKFKNKIAAAFGSYGWSGEAVKIIERELEKAGIPVIGPSVRCKWQPISDDLEAARELGRNIGREIKST